jgi:hypothetical protein
MGQVAGRGRRSRLSALRYDRDGNLTIRTWFTTLRGVQETAFFGRDDPLPFLGAGIMEIREIWHRRLKWREAYSKRETFKLPSPPQSDKWTLSAAAPPHPIPCPWRSQRHSGQPSGSASGPPNATAGS